MVRRKTGARARPTERSDVDVPENKGTGARKRKIKAPDLVGGPKKKTYSTRNSSNLHNFRGKKEVAPEKPLPRTRKSPVREIVLPRHVSEMDSPMEILLNARNDISHSKRKDYDAALGTIIGIQTSASCMNFLSYRPEARKFIPIMEHQEEIAKQKLESDKIITKWIAEVTELKVKVDEIAKENFELEKKSIDFAADRDYWKGKVVELERQPIKVLDSQSDAFEALQKKEDEIKALCSQVSDLNQQLIDAEKRWAATAENKLTQFGQLMRVSAEIAFGVDSGPNSHWQQMFANITMPELNDPKEMLVMRMSQLQGLGPPTILSTNSASACRTEAETSKNEEMDVDDDIISSTRASGIPLPVTWSSISLDSQKEVKSTLQGHKLNVEKIADKLEGPILVELMNSRMPPKKDLFESIVESQFSKYKAANGEGRFSSIELMYIHVKLALINMFPRHSRNVASTSHLNSNWKEEVSKLGIVEFKNSGKEEEENSLRKRQIGKEDMKFIENGFADYFVARWLAKLLLTEGGWNKELSIFFIEDAFALHNSFENLYDSGEKYGAWYSDQDLDSVCYTFLMEELCSLLNSFVGEQKESILGHLIDFTDVCDAANITAIGHACVHHGFFHLLKLILNVGTFKGSGIADLLFANSVIAVAIRKANLDFFKIAKSSFKKDCWMNADLKVKAIKKAAKRGDLPMVEFLLNEMEMSEMVKEPNEKLADLIHYCIEYSCDDYDDKLIEKTKILQLLNSVNPYLKNKISRNRKGPSLLGCKVHLNLLTELVELGADASAVDNHGDTVLHLNADSSEVFESLLNIIPDKDLKKLVHVKGFLGDTPLMRVVEKDTLTLQILKKLLAAEADVNVVDSEGYSVIAVAVKQNKSTSLINLLIDLGAFTAWRGKKHETLLHLAVCPRRLSTELVSVLLKNKIDPNCEDADGCTPLDYLFDNEEMSSHCDSTFTETVILLQNAGGKLKVKLGIDNEGQTLLHRQVERGTCCLIKLLVELGLNVNKADKDGNTPLHLVAHPCFWQTKKMECLLNNKANPDAMNANGKTPLHIGLNNKSFSLEAFQLLKSRTNVPLTEAFIVLQLEYLISKCIWYSTADLQDRLVSLKLDQKHYFQYKTKDGDSLLHVATIYGNESAVKLLVVEGLDINVRNIWQQTPLHVAANFEYKYKTIGMAKCLIENGADPCLKDADDYTFLHRFIMNNKAISSDILIEFIEYLLSKGFVSFLNIHGGPNGSTPLQEAVQLMDLETETITSLTSYGVDINAVDNHGDSVLSYAIRGKKDEKFLTNLAKMGLDWKHINFKGKNLLHIASQADNWKVAGLLLKNGVVWSEKDLEKAREFGWKHSQ